MTTQLAHRDLKLALDRVRSQQRDVAARLRAILELGDAVGMRAALLRIADELERASEGRT